MACLNSFFLVRQIESNNLWVTVITVVIKEKNLIHGFQKISKSLTLRYVIRNLSKLKCISEIWEENKMYVWWFFLTEFVWWLKSKEKEYTVYRVKQMIRRKMTKCVFLASIVSS